MRTSTMPTGFRHYALTTGKHLTSSELGESFQVTSATINNWIKTVGIGKRPRSNGVDKAEVARLLRDGGTVKWVAGRIQCSEATVKSVRRGMR